MRTRDYSVLHRKLMLSARNKRIPLRVVFELTYRCNHKCIHCYAVDQKRAELSTFQVKDIIEQLQAIGCFYLGFTGGEIFMREDIFEILFFAKRKGLQIILLTNGSLIDETFADKISRLSPNKVDITLLGSGEETFDAISGIKGSFKRVYKAISLLKERNVPLGLKTCLMKPNIGEFAEMKKFAKSLGVNFRFDQCLTPRMDGAKFPLQYRVDPSKSQEAINRAYPRLFARLSRNRPKLPHINGRQKKFFNCGAGKTELTINPYGELRPCIDIGYPKYDILSSSLKKCWQELKEFIDSLKPGDNFACDTCRLSMYCLWCPAVAFLENGDFSSCSPYHKELALMRAKLER